MSDPYSTEVDEADFDIDVGNVNPDDVTKGGLVNQVGRYHFEISDVNAVLEATVVKHDKAEANTPHLLLKLTVLETVPGQSPEGSAYIHRLYVQGSGGAPMKDTGKELLSRFCLRLGLMKDHDANGQPLVDEGGKRYMIDPVTNKRTIGISTLKRAKGLQVMAEIKKEAGRDNPAKPGDKFPDKYLVQFNEFYLPNHPAVAAWPKNAAMLAAAGYEDVSVGVKPGTSAPADKGGDAAPAGAASSEPGFEL